MPRLPNVTARALIAALARGGWRVAHTTGGHQHLKHPDRPTRLTVPTHSGDLKRSLLKLIIKQAGLTEDDLRGLL